MEEYKEFLSESKHVLTCELPCFVKIFVNQQETNAFVYNALVKVNQPSFMGSEEDGSKFDVTGSPLKYNYSNCSMATDLDLSNNPLPEEEKYSPLSQEDAMALLDSFTRHYFRDRRNRPWLWVLCKGSPILRAESLVDGWWSRVLVNQRPFCFPDELDPSALASKHTAAAKKLHRRIISKVVATFALDTSCTEKSKVLLELTWNQLVKEPPPGAKTIINIQCEVGSKAPSQWKQLCQICSLMQSLKTGDFSESLNGPGGVLERLSDTELLNTPSWGARPSSLAEAVSNSHITPLDTTDKLWIALSECQDHSDLKACLSMVFKQILVQDVTPQIRSTNSTVAAGIINDLISGKRTTPPLFLGNECIEILIVMGLEKLVNEYTHIFLSTDLLTLEKLKNSFNFSGSLADAERCLQWLAKRHAALELMLTLEEIRLDDCSMVQTLASQAIDSCDSSVTGVDALLQNSIVNLSASINGNEVLEKANGEFTHYSFTLKSRDERQRVKSVFHFSKSSIFPENIRYCEGDSFDISLQASDDRYEVTELLCISDKMF